MIDECGVKPERVRLGGVARAAAIGRATVYRHPHHCSYRAGTDLKVHLTKRISRADLVADFLLGGAAAPAWMRQTPMLAT